MRIFRSKTLRAISLVENICKMFEFISGYLYESLKWGGGQYRFMLTCFGLFQGLANCYLR